MIARIALIGSAALAGLALIAGPGGAQTAAPTPANPLVAEGEQQFRHKCAFCHVGPNTGTIMLGRRLGKAQAELPSRTDLDPAYIKGIVRGGLNNMPTITRVELTDQQLDAVAAYLTRNNPAVKP